MFNFLKYRSLRKTHIVILDEKGKMRVAFNKHIVATIEFFPNKISILLRHNASNHLTSIDLDKTTVILY